MCSDIFPALQSSNTYHYQGIDNIILFPDYNNLKIETYQTCAQVRSLNDMNKLNEMTSD